MKSAVVTGANRGLGYGFVEYLLQEGYVVFAGTRKITQDLQRRENLHWVELDVGNDDSIKKAFSIIAEKTQTLELLINNAGINKNTLSKGPKETVSKLEELDREALLEMFSINSVAPLIMTKHFLPLLSATQSFVINISSSRASFHDEFENKTGNYGYRASKVALNMLTFCSVFDLPKNVKTFSVHPGNVKSDMNPHGDSDPIVRAGEIWEITNKWKEEFNGKFIRYDGSLYPL